MLYAALSLTYLDNTSTHFAKRHTCVYLHGGGSNSFAVWHDLALPISLCPSYSLPLRIQIIFHVAVDNRCIDFPMIKKLILHSFIQVCCIALFYVERRPL